MQRLVDVPSVNAPSVEHADWVELTALFSPDGNTSQEDLARALRRPSSVSEDKARQLSEEAFNEIADRSRTLAWSSAGRKKLYPFKLVNGGEVLQSNSAGIEKERNAVVYVFMLAISRWSMHARKRRLKNIDPTATFERLCSDALMSYWGGRGQFADALTIGTSTSRTKQDFPAIINKLCASLREGLGWKKNAKSPGAGDGGVDIAVWRHFCDARAGGIVAFAQCKTGVHWQEDLGKLNPRAFSNLYFQKQLALEPVPVYMVPNRILGRDWERHTVQSRGIVFDRCRITQFAADARDTAITECRIWLKEALKKKGA
ncbi:MAG: hypothetical protein IT449_04345 [Phycisphaerales bacterium]|nr:hypothetical protein [Phycisphaerales bacterium]